MAADPVFDPLPGAEAFFGELNGGVFRIEMPDEWNGGLMLYMQGSQRFAEGVTATSPPFLRHYLIERGYAWASTSYDRTEEIYGVAADQSAALWDYFAREFGRPRVTFAVGDSMGGGVALISASRYAERYDGALAACGAAGAFAGYAELSHLVVAGAYATGMSTQEFADMGAGEAMFDYIRPRLATHADERTVFEEIWVTLTGGARPFAVEGLRRKEDALWDLARRAYEDRLVDNSATDYKLNGAGGVSDEEFNRQAVRVRGASVAAIPEGEDIEGNIHIPVLLLHTTGDGIVSLMNVQYIEDKVEQAGKNHLLSTQLVPGSTHCGFSLEEYRIAFEALVDWVESEVEPRCVLPLEDGAIADWTRRIAACAP
jgi:pimeloyl-ACP methyl ester carboxylesterase